MSGVVVDQHFMGYHNYNTTPLLSRKLLIPTCKYYTLCLWNSLLKFDFYKSKYLKKYSALK